MLYGVSETSMWTRMKWSSAESFMAACNLLHFGCSRTGLNRKLLYHPNGYWIWYFFVPGSVWIAAMCIKDKGMVEYGHSKIGYSGWSLSSCWMYGLTLCKERKKNLYNEQAYKHHNINNNNELQKTTSTFSAPPTLAVPLIFWASSVAERVEGN